MDKSTAIERVGDTIAHLYRQHESHQAVSASEDLTIPRCTIAIARQAGTHGAALARVLSRLLDWPVFDHELLDIIAKQMRLRVDQVESVDERPLGWFLESVEAFAAGHFASENAYVKYLAQTIQTLGKHGHCIIVGRGAGHILPAETTLRVRVVAPRKTRIETLSRKLSCSLPEAEKKMDQVDEGRTQFIEQHFYRNPNDPANYDVVLNSGRFSLEECAHVVVAALRALQQRLSSEQPQVSQLGSSRE
jgi:cytidylate kinase